MKDPGKFGVVIAYLSQLLAEQENDFIWKLVQSKSTCNYTFWANNTKSLDLVAFDVDDINSLG